MSGGPFASTNCKLVPNGTDECVEVDCSVGDSETYFVGGKRISGGHSFSQSKCTTCL